MELKMIGNKQSLVKSLPLVAIEIPNYMRIYRNKYVSLQEVKHKWIQLIFESQSFRLATFYDDYPFSR